MEQEIKQYSLEWYKKMRKLNKDTIISLVESNGKQRDALKEQTKQLLEEIERLKQSNSRYQQDYSDLQNRLIKQSGMLKFEHQENIRLRSELKAVDSVNEWISVDIEPNNDDDIVLLIDNKKECGFYLIEPKAFYLYKPLGSEICFPTHWMPLPNQPK